MMDANAPVLTGTLPVKPFGDQFYGIIDADGQEPKVAALACTKQGEVILLSMVGYDVSCGAAFAKLFLPQKDKYARFEPKLDVIWNGPTHLPRCVGKAKTFGVMLANTKERHQVALVEQANMHLGLLLPPELPEPEKPETEKQTARPPSPLDSYAPTAAGGAKKTWTPRYVLGNAGEDTPHRLSFLGQLRALRVIHSPFWADALWLKGEEHRLITPTLALGVRCWRLSGDLERWGALLAQGLKEGWLDDPDDNP